MDSDYMAPYLVDNNNIFETLSCENSLSRAMLLLHFWLTISRILVDNVH